MKKIMLTAIVVSAIVVTSCKKDRFQPQGQSPVSANPYNVSVKNNRLVFQSIDDYEKTITNPTPGQRTAFLKTIENFDSFTACSEKPYIRGSIDAAINDDYFKSILNSDLAVQIGEYIFRVNPLTEKVYALPVANEDQYQDLVNENVGNTNIQVFSTGDDVLELIAAKKGSSRGIFCKEDGIGGKDRTTDLIDVDNAGKIKMEGKIHFNRFGIYYSLFAEVKTDEINSGLVELTMDIDPLFYHVRCDETANYNVYGHGSESSFFYKKYQSYQGAKNLNKVYFRARFHGKVDMFIKDSDWIEIRVNA